MEKTIKELATEFNVSKQAIRKRIDKLPDGCYHVSDNGAIIVTEEGYKILKSQMSTRSTNVSKEPDTYLTQLVDVLMDQLKEKDRQIEELQKSLNQAQQLHMSDKLKLEDKKSLFPWRRKKVVDDDE